jgi:hypothetical protein
MSISFSYSFYLGVVSIAACRSSEFFVRAFFLYYTRKITVESTII